MVVSWLVHSVSLPIRQSVIWMDVAVDVWNDLKTRYSQGDLSRISDLQLEASSLSQNDLSVTDYFTKLRIIWDELDNFRPNSVCVCENKCSCTVASTISKRKCEDQAMQFLRGLNEQFSNIRSHVLLMEPVPPISKIFSLVAQQERQLASNFLITSINHTSTSRNSTITCSFCGKLGHTENVCFRKVGFPNQENKNFRFNNNRKVCTHCGKIGHTIDTCYRKHGFPPGYNPPNSRTTPLLNAILTDDVSSENCQQEQGNGDMCSAFTAQQCQVLSALLKQNFANNTTSQPSAQLNQVGSFTVDTNRKESPTGNTILSNLYTTIKGSWILDSGATDHVCTCLSDFTTYKSIKPVLISLPNGHCFYTSYSGTVNFSNRFYLTNVLYVPEFTFNLVSASKLASNLNCQLIFSSKDCVIQDNLTKEKIGTVDAKDGLYVFHASVFQRNVMNNSVPSFHCVTKDDNVWHNRLGHLSDERLHVLRSRYSCIPVKKPYLCDTCHRAKQRKLPFALSDSSTSKIFNILHMDIWGPCSIISMHGFRYFLTIVDYFSRYTLVIPMRTKSEVRTHVTSFISYVENHFQTTVKIIRSDNGAEFAMTNFFSSKGIIHQKTCIETPEQNGIVERKHQHILNVTRALLVQANLPPLF